LEVRAQDLDEWAAFQRKEQSTLTLRAAIRAPYVLANQPDSTPTQMSIKADIIARGCERKWARLNVLVLRNARTEGSTKCNWTWPTVFHFLKEHT
jgi:hypothetical protein